MAPECTALHYTPRIAHSLVSVVRHVCRAQGSERGRGGGETEAGKAGARHALNQEIRRKDF